MTADHDDAVRRYVAAVVGTGDVDRVTEVRRFEAGERHVVDRVTYVDGEGRERRVVVRVGLGSGPADRAEAAHEARVLGVVGGSVGPRLLDFRPTSGWFSAPVTCVECIDGGSVDLTAGGQRELELLGALVARVHGLPWPWAEGAAEPGDLAGYARSWTTSVLERLRAVVPTAPPDVRDRLGRALRRGTEALAAVGDRSSFRRAGDGAAGLAFLHGDVIASNVVWRPDPVLVDWEYARLGDPADEIAYVFAQHALGGTARASFWRGYGGDGRLLDRVAWWEPMVLLGSAVWWLERWTARLAADGSNTTDPSVPKDADYYRDHAFARLGRIEAD